MQQKTDRSTPGWWPTWRRVLLCSLLSVGLLAATGWDLVSAASARWRPPPAGVSLEAYPRSVAPGWESVGTTTLVWRHRSPELVEIWVSRDGEPEVKFAGDGDAGSSASAPWIATGSRYVFTMYEVGPPRVSLASATVTRQDDTARTVRIVLIAAALVLLLTPVRRGWLLDVGAPALVLASLWVKTIQMTALLRPGWGYIPTTRSVISGGLVGLLVLFIPLLWVPRRWRFQASLALNAIVTTAVLADLVHARFFDDVIGVSDLGSASNLIAVVPSIMALLRASDWLYYADVLVGLLLVPLGIRISRQTDEPPLAARRQLLRVSVAACVLLIPTARLAYLDPDKILASPWSRRALVAELGIVPFHFYDAATSAYRSVRSFGVSDDNRREAEQLVETLRGRAAHPSPLFGAARGRNLVLIQAESLSAFPVGLQIGGQAVTPHLDKFRQEALTFANFFDQTSLGSTADGTFTTLQSLHPAEAGVVNMRYVNNAFRALPAVLATHGYDTAAFWGATRETWNVGQMFERFGFKRGYFIDSFRVTERIQGWVPDREFLAQTLSFASSAGRPFMIFPATSSTHFPYVIPPQYRELALGALEGSSIGDYLQAVHYFDRAFGEFIDGLNARGLLEQSVVAIYGDHHARFEDVRPIAKMIGWPDDAEHLWQLNRRVPFMVRLPQGQGAGVRTITGGHLDIAPTLLSILGIQDGQSVMLGTDLTRGEDSLVVFRDGSFIQGDRLWITSASTGQASCYGQESGRAFSCAELRSERQAATTHLRVSDAILEANLVRTLVKQTP